MDEDYAELGADSTLIVVLAGIPRDAPFAEVAAPTGTGRPASSSAYRMRSAVAAPGSPFPRSQTVTFLPRTSRSSVGIQEQDDVPGRGQRRELVRRGHRPEEGHDVREPGLDDREGIEDPFDHDERLVSPVGPLVTEMERLPKTPLTEVARLDTGIDRASDMPDELSLRSPDGEDRPAIEGTRSCVDASPEGRNRRRGSAARGEVRVRGVAGVDRLDLGEVLEESVSKTDQSPELEGTWSEPMCARILRGSTVTTGAGAALHEADERPEAAPLAAGVAEEDAS
jgi:hypothetical protein